MPRFRPQFFPSTAVSDWSSGAFGGGASAPGAPGTLVLVGGEDPLTEIKLTWSPGISGSTLVTGFRIEVSTDGSSWSDQVANTSSDAVTYTATGIANNTTRYYRVSAINDSGSGDTGNEPNHTTSVPVAYSTTGSPSVSNYTVSGVAYKSLH